MSHSDSILLVDGDHVVRQRCRELLECAGYMVFESPGAAHARMFLRTITPAAVVIESDLPDGQGAEVLRFVKREPAMRRLLTQIASIASEILDGFPVEFWRIAEDRDGVFPQFRTLDGDIAFDVFSQGTQSILQWLAYVLISCAKYYGYPSNLAEQPGIMIIDEIDAHLHPTAQQRIIPVLRRHFPRMQIFCSTHSPLMLVGLKPGQIHMLQRTSQGTVIVSRNETAIIGQSTDALLQQFFGISAVTR